MLIGKNTLIKGYLKSTAEEYALNNDLRFEAIDYVHISDITLDKTSVQINRAETFTLIATISPSNATNKNITYKSSDETIVKVSESGVVTGIKVGKARITVTTEDGNKTAICDVEVMPKQITGIEVTTVPTKTNYIQNYENLDLTGGKITVTYNDETTDTMSLKNEKIKVTGFDNSEIGTNTITVEYEGKTSTFKIEIISKQITGIEITAKPTKTKYIQNYEKLDLTGGEITVRYNDETTDTISLTNEKIKVTGFDNSKIETNTITVEYEGKTSTFKIEIISKQITKIEIKTRPIKTKYIQNYENLDLTEGEITVRYNDETTDAISLTNEKIKVTGFDNSQIGINTITVEYEGKITKFDIEIIENQNNPIDKDDTISSGIFPQAGNQYTLITIIILVIIITVIFYKKWKNIKHIK